MKPPERLELCGITSASQPGTFARHSRSSASQRSSGVERIDRARGQRRDRRRAEDHVAVEVVRGLHALGPLVADEAREAARGSLVVRGVGRLLHLAPRPATRRDAVASVLAAEREARRTARVHEEECEARPAAVDHAHGRVVARRAGRVAQIHLAEQLGVIRDGSEVERPLELHGAPRLAARGERLEPERLTARECVRLARARACTLRARVERIACVHVQIAEPRPAQRVARSARLALLGALERGRSERRAQRQGEHRECAAPTHSNRCQRSERIRVLDIGVW